MLCNAIKFNTSIQIIFKLAQKAFFTLTYLLYEYADIDKRPKSWRSKTLNATVSINLPTRVLVN